MFIYNSKILSLNVPSNEPTQCSAASLALLSCLVDILFVDFSLISATSGHRFPPFLHFLANFSTPQLLMKKL